MREYSETFAWRLYSDPRVTPKAVATNPTNPLVMTEPCIAQTAYAFAPRSGSGGEEGRGSLSLPLFLGARRGVACSAGDLECPLPIFFPWSSELLRPVKLATGFLLERLRENLADFNEKLFKNLYQNRLDGQITGHVLAQIFLNS